MQRLEVSGAVRPICGSLGVRRLIHGGLLLNMKNTSPKKQLIFHFGKQYLHCRA